MDVSKESNDNGLPEQPLAKKNAFRSPIRDVLIIGLFIFFSQALVMVILQPQNEWIILYDPLLLIIILTPILYYYVVHPLNKHIATIKQTELRLRASEERYRLITNSIPVVISYLDNELRYQFNNARFEKQFGMTENTTIGHHIYDVINNSAYEEIKPHLEEALAGKDVRYEFEYNHYIYSVIIVPHKDTDGDVLGIYIMSHDITVQKQYEKRLQRSQRIEALGHLTSGFAHHFNNIQAIVLGYLEILSKIMQDTTNSKEMHYLEKITANVQRSQSLIKQLQVFSRKQILKPDCIDLNKLIMDMRELLHETVAGKNIKIETECAEELWCCFVDASQLEVSMLHIIHNACDAMSEGGKLTIEINNIWLDDDYAATHDKVNAGQYVVLAMTDTGAGMSDEVLEHVFEPFYTTKELDEGKGLSLSMVYGFAKQSKGHFSISSKLGEGTTTKLYLPQCESDIDNDGYS